jgi:hypothetical protein
MSAAATVQTSNPTQNVCKIWVGGFLRHYRFKTLMFEKKKLAAMAVLVKGIM